MAQTQTHPVDHTLQTSILYRLGRAVASHAWATMFIWLVVLIAALVVLPTFLARLTGTQVAVSGTASQQATMLVQRHFAQAFNEQDLIVIQSATLTVRDPAFQQVVQQAVQNVRTQAPVIGIVSPLDPQASDQVSSDGHAAAVLIGLRGSEGALQDFAPTLQRLAHAAATPAVRVVVTGESPLIADMATQETADLAQAERIGLPIALLVLLLAFGSLIAAGLPLLLSLVGVSVTFGALWVASTFASFGILTETIVTMIGLGVGIDYTMFITTRFREELARSHDPIAAAATSLATAGKAILFSGLTVIIALAALLAANIHMISDMAIGAMVAVAITLLVALTLLPAVLGKLGTHINRLALPFMRGTLRQPDADTGFWARWSRGVMRRPVLWVVLATVILLTLSAPLTHLKLGLNLGTDTLGDRPSGQGIAILQRYFSPGAIAPIQIIVNDPHGALNDTDLAVVAKLTQTLQARPDVARVVSLTGTLDQVAGNHSAQTLATAETQPALQTTLGYMVNQDRGNDTTIISVISRTAADATSSLMLVHDLRATLIPQAQGEAAVTILVSGFTAQIVDLSQVSLQKLPLVITLVLALAFLLLTLVFRSIFLPLKAIVMNLLSVGAAYGLLVLVFQDGWGRQLFHFTPVGFIVVYLPMLAFAFLFGLSMDYEVFMIGRMREEWERTGNNEAAVARGLQHSGRAITSAAAIMVVIFLAFTFTKMLEIQEIGFALAVAILVDATIVRILLVPAAMRLMGRWNWWLPGWLDRILPRISVGEGVTPEAAPAVAEIAPEPVAGTV